MLQKRGKEVDKAGIWEIHVTQENEIGSQAQFFLENIYIKQHTLNTHLYKTNINLYSPLPRPMTHSFREEKRESNPLSFSSLQKKKKETEGEEEKEDVAWSRYPSRGLVGRKRNANKMR